MSYYMGIFRLLVPQGEPDAHEGERDGPDREDAPQLLPGDTTTNSNNNNDNNNNHNSNNAKITTTNNNNNNNNIKCISKAVRPTSRSVGAPG